MNVFKNIKDAKYQIELLKAKIPSIKNQQQLDNHIKLINTMILLLNNIDVLMHKHPDVETIDVLLLSKLHGYFMEVYATNEKLPIHYIVNKIDSDIRTSKSLIKHQVIQLLKDIELNQLIKQIPVYQKDGLFKICLLYTSPSPRDS